MVEILAFGDSITYGVSDEKGGWVSRLRRDLEKDDIAKAQHVKNGVYNCGVRGDTTEDLLKRFDIECAGREGKEDNPVIIFAIGTNDCSVESGSSKVSPANYKENLSKLLAKAKNTGERVVFVGLTPVDETKTVPIPWKTERSYLNKSVIEYNAILKEFSKANGTCFVDVYRPFGKNPLSLLSDGLHPNSKGHQRIYKAVMKALKKAGYL
jgi:lysophospholipase L1-like esterase